MANSSSIIAGRGHVVLTTDQTLLDKGLAAATAAVQSWGKGIMAIGAGITAAGAAITTPMLKGLDIFIEMSGSALSASRRTGIGFEAIQGIAAGLRVDMEGLARSMMHMGVFLEGLAHGSHEAADAVRELRLDANQLLTGTEEERIRSITEAIAGMTDASQRGAMAHRIFGRQAFEMNFGGGVAGLRAREARARELGGVIKDEDKPIAQEAVIAQKEMAMAIRGLWAQIGAAAAGPMADFWRIITSIVVAVRKWVEENRPLLTTIFRIADACVTGGAIIGALGAAVYGASFAFTFIGGAIAIVATAAWYLSGAFIVAKVATVLWATAMVGAKIATLLFSGAALWASGNIFFVGLWLVKAAVSAMLYASGSLVAKAATLLLSVAMGILAGTTTVATAGLNLLIAGVLLLGAVIVVSPLIIFLVAIGGLLANLGTVIGRVASSFQGFAATSVGGAFEIATAFHEAWSGISSSFMTMAEDLLSHGSLFISGLLDLIRTGEWATVWELLKTAGHLAWLDIKGEGNKIWIELKYAALITWAEITAALKDAFAGGFIAIQQMWARLMAHMKGEWEVIKYEMRTLGGSFEADADAARAQIRRDAAASGEAAARRIARSDTLEFPGGPLSPVAQRRLDRENAVAALERLRTQEFAGAGLTPEEQATRAGLEDELRRLAHWAEEEAMMQARAREIGGDNGPGGRIQEAAKGMILGGFSAQQALGFLGATTTAETPIARLARIEEQVRDELVRVRAVLDQIRQNGVARFG